MTPFGALLRYYREVRGYSQQRIAQRISSDSKIISAIETGRRLPPEGDDFERLCAALNLSEDERRKLGQAAQESSYIIRISREETPRNIQFIHRVVKSLGDLGPEQVSMIEDLIQGRRSV